MKSHKAPSFIITVQGTSILKMILTLLLLLFLIFSISGLLTSLKPEYHLKSSSVSNAAINFTGKNLYQLFGWENHTFLLSLPEDGKKLNLSSLLFQISTNVNLDDPRSLLGRELPGFSLFDWKILVAGEGTNYTNLPIESAPPLEVFEAEKEASLQNIDSIDETKLSEKKEPVLTTGDKKIVYLYFSHTRESFLPYLKGVKGPNGAHHSQINITKIGDHLKGQLESLGIGTTVDKTDVMTKLNQNGLKYGKSYDESRKVIQAALTNNRELTYLIDIHRDSRRKKDTTKIINGVAYAKLAFIIGAENPNCEENYKLANEIHKKLENAYPGLSRGIIKKKGALTNGKFNQDLSKNALLIEFGGVDNTFEELNRSADAFAEVFSEIFWQAEKVNFPINPPAKES
jgi:stage II sporulation protein P